MIRLPNIFRDSAKSRARIANKIPAKRFLGAVGWVLLLALASSDSGLVAQVNGVDAELQKKQHDLRSSYHAEIQKLIRECDQASMEPARQVLKRFAAPFSNDRQTLFPLNAVGFESDSKDEDVQKILLRLRELNRSKAKSLFEIAREFADSGSDARAYQLIHEVLAHDPDHEVARKVLGFKKNSKDEWVRPTRKITARKASTKHSLIGWAARKYTIVDSGHYRIATTVDAEAGKALARKLERWHNLWRQLYFAYWSPKGTIKRWLDGKGSERTSSRKLKVVFFESRAEYVETLTRLGVRGVEVSSGYYNEQRKTMFFYAGGEDDPTIRATWLQEQAHQLFQETGVTKKDAIDDANIWAVEAVAMYFESMTEFPGYATFGGVEAQRLQYARIRVNRQGFHVPLSELIQMGRNDFQTNENIRSLYSQSAGLAHYFMGAAAGKYRDGFIEYIRLVYQKRTRPDTIAKLTGVELAQHDQAYRAFLIPDPKSLAQASQLETRTELALGGSPVTNQQIERLVACRNLSWLQLSGTKVDEGCRETVAELENLTQLFVDGTGVNDTFLKSIGHLSKLEELDLAGTAVTDRGLTEIAKLKKLRALYLTGTRITDEGLAKLAALSELEYLEVSKTKVSPAALKSLKSKLPNLK